MNFQTRFMEILNDENIDKITFENYGDVVLCTILDIAHNQFAGSDPDALKALEKSYDWWKQNCQKFGWYKG